jgi:hypothetical protein
VFRAGRCQDVDDRDPVDAGQPVECVGQPERRGDERSGAAVAEGPSTFERAIARVPSDPEVGAPRAATLHDCLHCHGRRPMRSTRSPPFTEVASTKRPPGRGPMKSIRRIPPHEAFSYHQCDRQGAYDKAIPHEALCGRINAGISIGSSVDHDDVESFVCVQDGCCVIARPYPDCRAARRRTAPRALARSYARPAPGEYMSGLIAALQSPRFRKFPYVFRRLTRVAWELGLRMANSRLRSHSG